MVSQGNRYTVSHLLAVIAEPFLQIFFHDVTINGWIEHTIDFLPFRTVTRVHPSVFQDTFVSVLEFIHRNRLIIVQATNWFDKEFIESFVSFQDRHLEWLYLRFPAKIDWFNS